MKTVLQFMRKQRGVTAIEYVMIGYFFCIFLIIGVETIGSRFNTNLFVRLLTHLTATRLGATSDAAGDVAPPTSSEAHSLPTNESAMGRVATKKSLFDLISPTQRRSIPRKRFRLRLHPSMRLFE